MKCVNCGAEISEDSRFCPFCGASVLQEPANDQPQQPAEPPKKKSRVWIPIVIIAAVLAIAAALLLGPFKGIISKLRMTPDEYFRYVVSKDLETQLEVLNGYDGAKTAEILASEDLETRYDLTLETSEELTSLLSEAADYDLSFLKNATITVSSRKTEDLQQGSVGVKLNDVALMTLDLFADMKGKKLLIGVPELSPLYADLMTLEGTEELAPLLGAGSTSDMTKAVVEKLPDAEAYKNWARHYAEPIYFPITGVERGKDTLSLGERSVKCTTLSVTLDQETVAAILKGVVDAYKNDEVIGAIMSSYDQVSPEISRSFYDDLDELDDDRINEAASKVKNVSILLYVDNKDRIIGSNIKAEAEVGDAGTALGFESRTGEIDEVRKEDLLFTVNENELSISGEGSRNDMDYAVLFESDDTSFSFDTKVELTGLGSYPQSYAFTVSNIKTDGESDLGSAGALLLRNYSFRLEGSSEDPTHGKLSLSAFDSKGELARLSLALSYDTEKKSAPQLPAEENILDLSDSQTALFAFVGSADFEQFFSNLRAAGLSEDLVSSLEGTVSLLQMFM